MDSLVLHYLLLWKPLGYAIIFFGMMIEGDALLFMAALLTHQGFFDIGDMAFFVFFGVLIGDTLWYLLGVWFTGSIPVVNAWVTRLARPFDHRLHKRSVRTIFISKFMYGLHRSILIRAGSAGVPLKTFIKADLLAATLWILIIGGLGYLSSASLSLFKHYIRFTEVAILLALIIFLAFDYFFSRAERKKLL